MPDGEERVALVVDDVEQMTATVADFLERRIPGLKVVALTKPKDALAWLQAAPRVDLILTDNHMDEMDGLEFLAQCRRLAPSATRALMTAYLDIQPPQIAAAGLHAVIRKPWEWTEFARFAHEMISLTPDDRARVEATGPLAYPRDALAEFAAPKSKPAATVEAPMPARPRPAPAQIERIPPAPPAPGPRPPAQAPAPRSCPHCHAPLEAPEPLSDEEEAWRIVALLQARPGIAQRFLAIQAARAPPKGPPPGPRKPK